MNLSVNSGHRMNFEMRSPLQYLAGIFCKVGIFFFKCVIEFHSETIWASRGMCVCVCVCVCVIVLKHRLNTFHSYSAMLQFMGSQRAGWYLKTQQQQQCMLLGFS